MKRQDAIAFAATLAVIAGGAALLYPDADEAKAAGACVTRTPEHLSATTSGRLTQVADASVVSVRRDATVTVVAYCQADGALPAATPHLEDGGRTLRSVGGNLTGLGDAFVNYVVYPPTHADVVHIVQGRERLAVAHFDAESPSEACPHSSTAEVKVVACGATTVLEWTTNLRHDPRKVELVDVTATDGVSPSLNFYLHGITAERGRLVVTFGIISPQSDEVRLRMDALYLDDGRGAPKGFDYDPPIEQLVTLGAPAGSSGS